jgi:hypothetical protein
MTRIDSGQAIWPDSKLRTVNKAKSSGRSEVAAFRGRRGGRFFFGPPPYRHLEKLSSLQRETTTIFGANLVVNLTEK